MVYSLLLMLLIAGCGAIGPAPTPTAIPATATPTATPLPTPTPTPIPPLALTLHRPEDVSALAPLYVEASLVPPPGVETTATLQVRILAPSGTRYGGPEPLRLAPQGDHLYRAETPVRFSLHPEPGTWRLIVDAQSSLTISGTRAIAFRPAPLAFRALTETLPPGATIDVPEAFAESDALGNRVAGGRIWETPCTEQSAAPCIPGAVELWWTLGPAEPLLLDLAVTMLETTHDPQASPEVTEVEETTWGEYPAFHFRENWSGSEGGPAEAWVIQGPDYRLYLLRVRALGADAIPTLAREVGETFTLTTP